MRVLSGKSVTTMSRETFVAVAANYDGVDVDIGTGDGRFVLDRAKHHPDRLIVGLDPVAEAMQGAANRVSRPRTRQENVLFVVASVEQMPVALHHCGVHVFINFPWGSLMRGLILGEPEILKQLWAIGRDGATYRITLNLRIFDDPVPTEVRELPKVTVDYVNLHLVDRYQTAGLRITGTRTVSPDELRDLPTTWSRRLSHSHPPPSLRIDAQRV